MKPTITRVIPLYPQTNFIQWTVEDDTNVLQSFSILRSGSPEGPFETVATGVSSDSFFYNDPTPNPQGLTTRIWYKIQAIPVTGAINAVLSEAATPSAKRDYYRDRVGRKARRDLSVALSKLSGVRIAILKKKRFGTRCTECYDEVTKESVLSHCSSCYGSTFDGGYHTPYYAWGKIDPASVQELHDRSGASEVAVFGITILDYPLVEIGDVVVENETNRRFVVKRKGSTESSGITVHQDLQVSELSRSSAVYAVNVDYNK